MDSRGGRTATEPERQKRGTEPVASPRLRPAYPAPEGAWHPGRSRRSAPSSVHGGQYAQPRVDARRGGDGKAANCAISDDRAVNGRRPRGEGRRPERARRARKLPDQRDAPGRSPGREQLTYHYPKVLAPVLVSPEAPYPVQEGMYLVVHRRASGLRADSSAISENAPDGAADHRSASICSAVAVCRRRSVAPAAPRLGS